MKIYVYMKDPDTMYDSVLYEVKVEVKKLGLPADEANALVALKVEKEREKMKRWFEYGEYLGVDFDTEAMTATVRAQP